jgi:two-component system NarL family sensor kinase
VQRCIVETRTLSHLLHPPLLDEAGFASAARCYVEEFDKRSEIDLRLELPDGLPRLIPALELALFRALQESLTNVHRYSGSSSVDIKVTMDAQSIVLTVRDYGRGIPEEILRNFHEHGSGVGVGLSGMRERMNELGGNLELASDHTGTVVTATLPLSNPHGKEIHLSSIA